MNIRFRPWLAGALFAAEFGCLFVGLQFTSAWLRLRLSGTNRQRKPRHGCARS